MNTRDQPGGAGHPLLTSTRGASFAPADQFGFDSADEGNQAQMSIVVTWPLRRTRCDHVQHPYQPLTARPTRSIEHHAADD